ncbi:MAG: GNAT family N-acetyltransferase [Candidatus Metalachnospira sp.]|nr:GNAT family N-acetyltransferase [Candidatus Metalachnospira sp.]
MELETERLILRHIIESDDEDIFEYSSNPLVGPDAGWKPHENIEETRQIMKEIFLDQESVFGMVLKKSGKLIGSVGLIPDPKRENQNVLMLGYAMSHDYWGIGLMTEASKEVIRYGLEDLNLSRISCCCYPFNSRSRSVIKKCGFEYEGTLKDCEMRYDGEIFDFECYSLAK